MGNGEDVTKKYFIFRDCDGRIKARNNKRWFVPEDLILAWADTLEEAKEKVKELNVKMPLFRKDKK